MRDCIVIGSGIAGVTAALYLKKANKDVMLVERKIPGGAINTTSSVKNYPGIVSCSGPEFSELLYNQVTANNIEYVNKEVVNIIVDGDIKKVVFKDEEVETKYIVIATGKEARKLGLPNEDELVGHGVSYCALCDGNFYKDKDVAVVGTGTAAVEEALYLSGICKKVTVLTKYDYFKCDEALSDELKNKENVEILYCSFVDKINSKDGKLCSIDYKHEENISNLEIEGLFIYIGSTPNIFNGLSLELDGNNIKVNEYMETSIKGVYAAGDIVKKNLYQLVTAASDGAIAATSIIKELNKK